MWSDKELLKESITAAVMLGFPEMASRDSLTSIFDPGNTSAQLAEFGRAELAPISTDALTASPTVTPAPPPSRFSLKLGAQRYPEVIHSSQGARALIASEWPDPRHRHVADLPVPTHNARGVSGERTCHPRGRRLVSYLRKHLRLDKVLLHRELPHGKA